MAGKSITFFYRCSIFLSAILFFSCGASYDSLIRDFEEKIADEPHKETSILDPDFSESKMIPLEYYNINPRGVFSLSAPKGGKTYKWELSRDDLSEPIVLSTTKELVLAMPGDFSTDIANTLLLTVTTALGTEYKDKATILLK